MSRLRTDVWSLGCILFCMAFGQPPFFHLRQDLKIEALRSGAVTIEFNVDLIRRREPDLVQADRLIDSMKVRVHIVCSINCFGDAPCHVEISLNIISITQRLSKCSYSSVSSATIESAAVSTIFCTTHICHIIIHHRTQGPDCKLNT